MRGNRNIKNMESRQVRIATTCGAESVVGGWRVALTIYMMNISTWYSILMLTHTQTLRHTNLVDGDEPFVNTWRTPSDS